MSYDHYDHDTLVQRAEAWLKRQNCGIVFNDSFRGLSPNGEQPDAIGWRHTVSILIECKATRSDFLADRKKRFRADPAMGMGDWRFFLCPPGVVEPADLPEGWGLLHATGKQIRRVQGVPPNTQWRRAAPFCGHKESEMALMYAALRRMAVRGYLEAIYEPLDARAVKQDWEG